MRSPITTVVKDPLDIVPPIQLHVPPPPIALPLHNYPSIPYEPLHPLCLYVCRFMLSSVVSRLP